MQSDKIDLLYKELKNIGNNESKFYLYKRLMNRGVKKVYNSWVLCCGFTSVENLENEWEDIIECFACDFQTQLESEIERSNLYVVFFIENSVPNNLKMEIEYDRYSSRKIIINQKYPENLNQLEDIIENLIFNIRDYKEVVVTKTLSKWLQTNEPILDKLSDDYSKGVTNISDAFWNYSKL